MKVYEMFECKSCGDNGEGSGDNGEGSGDNGEGSGDAAEMGMPEGCFELEKYRCDACKISQQYSEDYQCNTCGDDGGDSGVGSGDDGGDKECKDWWPEQVCNNNKTSATCKTRLSTCQSCA